MEMIGRFGENAGGWIVNYSYGCMFYEFYTLSTSSRNHWTNFKQESDMIVSDLRRDSTDTQVGNWLEGTNSWYLRPSGSWASERWCWFRQKTCMAAWAWKEGGQRDVQKENQYWICWIIVLKKTAMSGVNSKFLASERVTKCWGELHLFWTYST